MQELEVEAEGADAGGDVGAKLEQLHILELHAVRQMAAGNW